MVQQEPTGNIVKRESIRHSLASRGIKTALPKSPKGFSSSGSLTPNFDMVKKGKMSYDDFKNKNRFLRFFSVSKITDPKLLEQIALKEGYLAIRYRVIDRITNPKILKIIAKNDKDYDIRKLAVQKITDQKFFEKVAMGDRHYIVRAMAISKLKNQSLLKKISSGYNEQEFKVKTNALKRITDVSFLQNQIKGASYSKINLIWERLDELRRYN